jgi:hypothetical protein
MRFIVIAVVLFGIAVYFANQQPFSPFGPMIPNASVAPTPNWVAAFAVIGFTFAGSVSLVCAAITREKT